MQQHMFVSFFVLFLFCGKLRSQDVTEEVAAQEAICRVYDNCDSCIQGGPYCVWCYQKNFNGDRCGPKSLLMKRRCAEENVHNGENSAIVKIDSDKDFNDVTAPDNMEESVQIKPQKISVKLQLNQPLTLQFKYRLAKNYPLDLYYLMDLTLTMEPDVMTMANLGKELTEVLQNLTQHFRVAFGYYSDKVEMPFSKMTKEFVENPCSGSGKQCRRAFDFIHSLNFTNNVDEFIKTINSSRTTANLDNLEGGFDALYQIILCEDRIQWRKNSRKMIVVATDGTLHFAGDGILAGAVRRNVKECFLDTSGIYKASLIYDYPSLEEVYHRLLRHKMNVLFAAKEDALKYYKNINKVIPSVSYVGKLAEKSTNVLNLVKEGYFNVVQTVKFSANASENLKITFQSKCDQKRAWNMSSMCDNVEEGKEYVFNVTLEVKQLPANVERETVIIEEQNIAEKFNIEVEYVGKCKCSQELDNTATNKCSNHGTYICGMCKCEKGWEGESCDMSCTEQRFEECREKNESYTSSTCYGRGDCYCGKCICDEDYTGKYCQERQCPKNKVGEVCSGFLHGTCLDGKCNCTEFYSGKDCSCSTSKKNCLAPGSEQVCSGEGYCRCGKCICFPKFSGEYCEICPTCTGLCTTYEECVLDTLVNKTNSKKCSAEDGTKFIPQMIDYSLTADDITICQARYEKQDGQVCDAQYKYTIKKDLQTVELQIYNECRQPVKAGTLIGIIIGVILGIGIMLILVWKAKLMNDDRREYAKFQENLRYSKTLEENPLYNSPIRMYEMPTELTYRGSSHE